MKICIIAFANLMITPYIKTYTEIFQSNCISYDIITWNRYGIKEEEAGSEKIYCYEKIQEETGNLLKKVFPMIRFVNFVKSIVKKNKYDKVVVLTSLPGVLLEKYLVKSYKNKYIFDIRDHSYEHIGWYYKKMQSLMKNSLLNVISSPGFENFLPKEPYVVDHNCTFESVSQEKFVKKTGEEIIVSFIGNIRYECECKKFIDKIKDSKSIRFHFYGRGQGEKNLKKYCIVNSIKNVEFFGGYEPKEKETIIKNSDILFNAYGNKSIHVKYALSNKYYEAMYYKKPLVVNSDTAMAQLSKGLSFEVDYNTDVSENLIEWYNHINPDEFETQSNKYLQNAIKDNEITRKRILEVIGEVV